MNTGRRFGSIVSFFVLPSMFEELSLKSQVSYLFFESKGLCVGLDGLI